MPQLIYFVGLFGEAISWMPRVLANRAEIWRKWVHLLLENSKVSMKDIRNLSLIVPAPKHDNHEQGAVNQDLSQANDLVLEMDLYDKILLSFLNAGEYEVIVF